MNRIEQTSAHHPSIFQINVSDGGVPKFVIQRTELGLLGMIGDRQANQVVHGGPERAVCLYSLERIIKLQSEGHPVFPGAMGENLTLLGLDWERVVPGIQMQIGESVIVEITKYTTPCNSLLGYFRDGNYGRVSQNLHPGWARVYARVLRAGPIEIGNKLRIIEAS